MKAVPFTLLCFISFTTLRAQSLHSLLTQTWENGTWQNSTLETFTNDSVNATSMQITQRWSPASNAWVNSRKWVSNNNGERRELNGIGTEWDSLTGAWKNTAQVVDNYGDNKKLTSYLIRKWVSGNWEDSCKRSFYYDSKGGISKLTEQRWNATKHTWDNAIMFNYKGAKSGYRDYTGFKWDTTQAGWRKVEKQHYTLDGKGLCTIQTGWYNRHGHWLNNTKSQLTYNANDKLTQVNGQTWKRKKHQWVTTYLHSYTYNTSGERATETVERLNKKDGTLKSKQMTTYSYL